MCTVSMRRRGVSSWAAKTRAPYEYEVFGAAGDRQAGGMVTRSMVAHSQVRNVQQAQGDPARHALVADAKVCNGQVASGKDGDAGHLEGQMAVEQPFTQCVQHCQAGDAARRTSFCSPSSSIVMPYATGGNGEILGDVGALQHERKKTVAWSRRRRRLLLKSSRRSEGNDDRNHLSTLFRIPFCCACVSFLFSLLWEFSQA